MTDKGCCHSGFEPQSFGFFFCRLTTATNPPARYGWKALPVLPIQKKSFRDGLVRPVSSLSDFGKKKGTSPNSAMSSPMKPASSTSSVSAVVPTIADEGLPVSIYGIGSNPASCRLRPKVSNIVRRCSEYATQNVISL